MADLIPDLSLIQWTLIIISAFLIRSSKTGLAGAGMIAIPIMAKIFGGKMSAGLVLPMLCIADVFAVIYYNRHAEWKYLFKLLPWAIVGVLIGSYVGEIISDKTFKHFIGIIVIGSVAVMLWQDLRKKQIKIPDYYWFAATMGLLGGFATMIGNAAGGIMALYLLSMRLPKNVFIGTGAWFFFLINLFKVPFHVFIWETITIPSLFFNLLMVPALSFGAVTGFYIVRLIPEKPYRVFIIVITFISSLLLFR